MTDEDIAQKTEEIIPENKSAKETLNPGPLAGKSAKEGSFMPMIIVMLASLAIAFLWDKVPAIKNAIHVVLNPTAGALMNWNLTFGLIIIVFILTLITTLVQKYTTDQKTLKELKAEQKELQKQMKEFKNHPEKLMDLQKKTNGAFSKADEARNEGNSIHGCSPDYIFQVVL